MADEIEAALQRGPATPAGRQAVWWLTRVHRQGEGASLADLQRYEPGLAARFTPPKSDSEMGDSWRANAARLGVFHGLSFEAKSPFELTAKVQAAKDRRWEIDFAVEDAPPHRLTKIEWRRIHDFELDVREAGPADWAILTDIERRCPIVVGDTSLWFDRGEHYFDFSRLMEDCTVGLASVDGAPAAVTCGARHRVRIGGEMKSIVTVSHLRVLPEHQRKGLWGAANRVLDKYWPAVDGSNAYIAVGNAGMQHGFRHTPNKWPAAIWWARLDCARLAGPPAGRSAAQADGPMIAQLLNAFHGDEEMFVPYDEASLAARLARAAELYSWDKVRLADGAVVGVWPAGRALRLVTERGAERSVSESGVVLDYGFVPGAEAAFEALLRGWCGWLAERGMDRLSIFTSPAARGADLIRALADDVEHFNIWTPGIPTPPQAETKGLYVDPIYF